jgi:hypothetical protein
MLTERGFSCRNSVEITDDPSDNLTITFFDDLTPVEADMLDTVVAAFDGPLYVAKEVAKRNIDVHTREVLAMGFLHDGNLFSLTVEAQANWNRMSAQHAAGNLTFPTNEVSTRYGGRHTFSDAAAFESFEGAYIAAIESVLESGRALKDQIDAAVSVDAVWAIEDTR